MFRFRQFGRRASGLGGGGFVVGLAALALASGLGGCEGVPYVLHLAEGELRIQGQVEPIDDVLASGRLSAQDAGKLRYIVKVRDYAAQTMGLSVGRSYTTFYDTGQDPQAWNLSAARRDALVPKTWTFLVVGEVPYVSFFDENYMRAVEQQLIDQGYDTLTYELDAYSTLGLFDDPVRSTMLQRDVLSLTETVIHELLHNTIYRANDTNFNESLATFVGRQGAVELLRAEFGDASELPAIATAFYADTDAVNAFLLQLYADLEEYYAQPLSAAEKAAGREAVYQAARERFVADVQPTLHYPDSFASYADLPTNNAWVLASYRYNLDLDVFAKVYAATGQDWGAALDVYRAAAAATEDPFDYLRGWLAQHETSDMRVSPVRTRRESRDPG
jgi:predicted aminopeptidase